MGPCSRTGRHSSSRLRGDVRSRDCSAGPGKRPDHSAANICGVDDQHALRPAEVIRRTIVGAASLGGGQVASQVLNIAGLIVLARMMTPAEFGLVAILTFLLALLTAVGDLGLGMSLVRQGPEPSEADFRAVSTFQRVMALGIALAALAAAPGVVLVYDLAPGQWWLFPVMALAIAADAVRFYPLAKFERRLRYEYVGAVEITQAVVFNIALLGLAISGYKSVCFSVAVVLRSSAGAILANAMGERLPGWLWDWPVVKRYLSTGLPYQGVHLMTVIRNSIVPVFIALVLGRAAVGHLEWAAMVAGFPLTGLILLQRLYVGSFSRLRAHPEDLRRFVTRLIVLAHAMVAPLAVLTLVLLDPIVRTVFGENWLPAMPIVRWLWLGCLVIPTTAPLTGLLHAFGKSRVVFAVACVGLIATWVVGVPLVFVYGEVGIAIGMLSIHVAGAVIWRTARQAIEFRILRPAALVWACALPAGAVAWWWQVALPITSIPQLMLCGAVAALVYGLVFGFVAVVSFPSVREALVLGSGWPTTAFKSLG